MTTAQRSTDYHDRVVAAARGVFAEQGFDAPISEVAQRAGVGVASIYRRYASKMQLAEHVRISCLRRVVDEATAAQAQETDPWRAFTRFLFRCLAEDSGVGTVLPPDDQPHAPEYRQARQDMVDAVEALVRAAHESGDLRGDFAAADVIVLFKHLHPALPTTEVRRAEFRARYLALVVEGLRARHGRDAEAGAGLPSAEPTWDEVHAMRRAERPS